MTKTSIDFDTTSVSNLIIHIHVFGDRMNAAKTAAFTTYTNFDVKRPIAHSISGFIFTFRVFIFGLR